MIGRNDPCWCQSGKKWKQCHYPRPNPEIERDSLARQYRRQYGIILKDGEEIQGIRKASGLSQKFLTLGPTRKLPRLSCRRGGLYCLDTTPLSDNLWSGALAWVPCQEFLGKTTSSL